MSRFVSSAILAAGIAAFVATPNAAIAGCYNCYTPPAPQPCATCYQQQVVPPQYRTTYDTVMVSPGRTIAHHKPARYGTVYETVVVPRTVMVEPERVYHQHVAPQYATVPRVEMVAPAQTYVVPVQPRCGG